jgi:Zn-dependent M28 family amino/carboxypeptidase
MCRATSSASTGRRPPTPHRAGVSDDGSGIAAVLELARAMSRHEFPNTVVFIAFAGEEEGPISSTLYAERARRDGAKIEGVLNNDIIGTDIAGDGRRNNRAVDVRSGDPADLPSRTLARYVKSAAERYFPAMRVNPVFRDDRCGRAGDHTPFDRAGYAAVRFTPLRRTSRISTTRQIHSRMPRVHRAGCPRERSGDLESC